MHLCNCQHTIANDDSQRWSFFVVDKEAVSPDGDSTTAPPSQASEHSEANHKQSHSNRAHPIDAALGHQVLKNQIDIQPDKVPATANNHNESVNQQQPKQQTPVETVFSNIDISQDDGTTIRNKLESPTGSYDSNNSNANNVPGQISTADITRMKKV